MHLTTQLLASGMLAIAMILIHALGVIGTTRLLRIEDRNLRSQRLDASAFALLISMGLCLFALHTLEIALFALFYFMVGAIAPFGEALFFSASSYTTLGAPDAVIPNDWKLVGALEGLVGFLLIGWSTAVFVTDMNQLLRKVRPERGPDRTA
jgi:hypothetical protein